MKFTKIFFLICIFLFICLSLSAKDEIIDKSAPLNYHYNRLKRITKFHKENCESRIIDFAYRHLNNIKNQRWFNSDLDDFENSVIMPIISEFNSVFILDSELIDKYKLDANCLYEVNKIDVKEWISVVKAKIITWLDLFKGKYEGAMKNYYSVSNSDNKSRPTKPEKEYRLYLKKFKIPQYDDDNVISSKCGYLMEYLAKIYKIEGFTYRFNHFQIFSEDSAFFKGYPDEFVPVSESCNYSIWKENNSIFVKCSKHGLLSF